MLSRRSLLLGGLGALAACTARQPAWVEVDGVEARAVEATRGAGRLVEARLRAQVSEVDIGGRVVSAWTYGGRLPGAALRISAGERLRATLVNELPTETSVHWHGLALRNAADGVPHVTQPPIAPGTEYVYEFSASHPGTYWFHPHSGLQLERGLYAPLIVDDPRESLSYDDEWTVVFDDWLDRDPDAVFASLRRRRSMMGGGLIPYPCHLLNGRAPSDPAVFVSQSRRRLRLRLINAAADTMFRVSLGGHRLAVTHTDGFPVVPLDADTVLLGMGERYDVMVTLADGVFPLVALAEGKSGAAFGLIRTGSGAAPPPTVRPRELAGRSVSYGDMRPAAGVTMRPQSPDRLLRLVLTGGMMSYDWGIDPDRATVVQGERVRVDYVNSTMHAHPIHLHGHTFAVGDAGGVRKDTVIVQPGQTLRTVFDADNPGRWMAHCHNAYHAEAGMMALLGYERR